MLKGEAYMANKVTIPVNCENCLFFNDLINATDHTTCKNCGILPYNSPCSSFSINTNEMTLINNDDPKTIAYIRSVKTNKLNELAALLVQEGYNRAQGWSIGDIAYYNIGLTGYISSYVQVIFKGLAGNLGLALIEGVRNKNGQIWRGMTELKYLIKEEDWPALHKKLLAEGKVKDNSLEQRLPGLKSYPQPETLVLENYKPSDIMDLLKDRLKEKQAQD